jgi:hypothetical protein
MAGFSPFVRQLGYQSGVQMNQIDDQSSDGLTASNYDQIFAVAGRFQRGRIDKSFVVDGGTYASKLGLSASIGLSGLNECYTQVVNALNKGAYQCVVSRLAPAAAVNSYMVFTLSAATPAVGTWSTSASVPSVTYAMLVKHLECHNDGVTVRVNAIPVFVNGVEQTTTSKVRLQILDNQTGLVLNGYDFTGYLSSTSVDEYGVSNYLPDIVAAQTNNVQVTISSSWTSVTNSSAFYGNDSNGNPVWNSANLSYFSESGTTYATSDYTAAMTRLQLSDKPFGYLISGGSQSPILIADLLSLASTLNVQFLWDIPGSLTPAAAITFYSQFNVASLYSQAYWAPLMATDPLNGGSAYYGTASDNVGYRCARNANTDSNGLAPKNYPIAGQSFPLTRTKIVQTYTPSDVELSNLAQSRINPVMFVRYNAGGKYVFYDSLTGANSEGATKLINVAEMSTCVDQMIALFGQQCLQLPMTVGIKRMTKFLKDLFAATDAAGWTIPAADPNLKGLSNLYTVAADNNRPFDRLDVDYWVRYDGTVRAIYQSQHITK